ncbi:MAG TPA: NAD(+)/NADH kinase [Phototrophicaceae bacterium]|nr:NAD(+)/NADH kinase [Phototrophicaceae bacterium]
MTALTPIGVLAHPLRPQTAPVAEQITRYLQARGRQAWCCTHWDDQQIKDRVAASAMVIAIGGDGAMLRAARVCSFYEVPVLGINMGQLGFLTEIDGPESWEHPLETVLGGNYWIEERMMIRAELLRDGLVAASGDALNDVVISRKIATRMIWLETYIDKDWATTYNADALIVATATGSTAYALACGGPILPPELHNILIVPVAPHLSMNRPLVLSEGATVEVVAARDNYAEMVLTLDGVFIDDVVPGDTIRVYASPYVSRFVRVRGRNYFYRSLLDRLEPRVQVRAEPEHKQI